MRAVLAWLRASRTLVQCLYLRVFGLGGKYRLSHSVIFKVESYLRSERLIEDHF